MLINRFRPLSQYFAAPQPTYHMKRILVPCDFSKPAINAYRFALDIASRSNGTIHLLHVIELPVVHDPMLMSVSGFQESFFKDLKDSTEGRLKEIADSYRADGVKVTMGTGFGPVIRTISDIVDKQSIDLVVAGSHGTSGALEFVIGSNAEKLIRTSSVPVLIIKEYYLRTVRDIVFPNGLDADGQEDLVAKVKALQNFFNARLHIVWINTPLNFTSDMVTKRRLEAFAKRFMLKDYTINVFNCVEEELGILEFSKQVNADLIAMGTHGRKGISHLINGSLAEDVANHSKGLVWTYALKRQTVTG